jgi:hypothetical protein
MEESGVIMKEINDSKSMIPDEIRSESYEVRPKQ